MGTHAKLWSLRASLSLAILFPTHLLLSQAIPADSIIFKEEITAFSQDRTGNIFLSFKGGAIAKYSPTLDSILSYSPTKIGDITLLEAWHGFQIFAFYEAFQEFMLLDRFLTRDTRYRLSESTLVYADICTLSNDQNLWVFEENQLRLLKVNLNVREVEIETPLEFIIDLKEHKITYLREYQNLLFLVDELSGIYVFDNLGNFLRRIDAPGIVNCSFNKDQLYYLQNNEVHSLDLYKGNTKALKLKAGEYLGVLKITDSILVIKKDKVLRLPFD